MDAAVDIDDFNDRLDLKLPEEEDTNSLGGFLAHLWHKVPVVGEKREHEGTSFEILKASETRVELVRVTVSEAKVKIGDSKDAV